MPVVAVVLAAGLGTRMKSRVPKMLHLLGGKPLLSWAVSAAEQAGGEPVLVVVGPEGHEIRREMGEGVDYVLQSERLGTGHALLQVATVIGDQAGTILVINGDLPLVRASTLTRLVEAQLGNDGPMCLLTAVDNDHRGFGRILRNPAGEIEAIIEEAHATQEQRAIHELNVGAYCFKGDWLWPALNRLPLSPKGEYYLTDLVALAREQELKVGSVEVETLDETIGVNTRAHLAQAEGALRQRINFAWLQAGVSMQDPSTTYIDPDVTLGADTTLLANTHITGTSQIGAGCTIGPNTIIRDSSVGENCVITSSVLEGALLEDEVKIGPFAHLRKGANLGRGVHMGNFGEVKNSRLDAGVKMGHFSYIGDAHIGENTNIGAGTITCNFDGEQKNRTEIGANVFIGSDTMLVAPLKIGAGARTGAGSVVTKDIPPNSLAVGAPARVIRKLENSD